MFGAQAEELTLDLAPTSDPDALINFLVGILDTPEKVLIGVP
jgi:hypothetical protein